MTGDRPDASDNDVLFCQQANQPVPEQVVDARSPTARESQQGDGNWLALHARVLDILNRSDNQVGVIRQLLLEIKRFTGFEAVGIRLREGEDFPYYETSGFPARFLQAERFLCARDRHGQLVRDTHGNPYLECMCGNVICGRTDPAQPFFTRAGSFWSNSTTRLLAETTEEDRQTRTRNRCHGEGYESVALIPLRKDDLTIGLLQLNDRRPNRFTAEMIEFFEGLGAGIGVALARQQAEALLQQQKEFAERLIGTAQAIVLVLDTGGRIVQLNPYMEKLTGYRLDEVRGKDWFHTFLPPRDRKRARSAFQEILENGAGSPHVDRIVTKNGREREIEWYDKTMTDAGGNVVDLVAIGHDLTERRELERALARLAVQERRRLGQDLHDGLGQDLTGLGYLSELLHNQLKSEGHSRENLSEQLAAGLKKAVASVRAIAKGLLPVEVGADGLIVALNQLLAGTQARTDISCGFSCDQNLAVDEDEVATELFYIAAEAVNNAAKHARARRIEVELVGGTAGTITLRVHDDGQGLPASVYPDEGLGLRIMQHRASLIGAVLQIRPANGGGTDVVCIIPRKAN